MFCDKNVRWSFWSQAKVRIYDMLRHEITRKKINTKQQWRILSYCLSNNMRIKTKRQPIMMTINGANCCQHIAKKNDWYHPIELSELKSFLENAIGWRYLLTRQFLYLLLCVTQSKQTENSERHVSFGAVRIFGNSKINNI